MAFGSLSHPLCLELSRNSHHPLPHTTAYFYSFSSPTGFSSVSSQTWSCPTVFPCLSPQPACPHRLVYFPPHREGGGIWFRSALKPVLVPFSLCKAGSCTWSSWGGISYGKWHLLTHASLFKITEDPCDHFLDSLHFSKGAVASNTYCLQAMSRPSSCFPWFVEEA